MKVGKLSSSDLQQIILNEIQKSNEDILVYPKIGEDCGAISFGDFVCVTTTDPVTAGGNQTGKLAVYINCNDIASSGAKPIAILTTILLPPSSTKEDLKQITTQISQTANELGVAIIGGHTEITDSVTRPIVSATAIGKSLTGKMITTAGSKPNDMIVMTKSVALEGTAILAHEFENELKEVLTDDEIKIAKNMMDNISVVDEGIIAGKLGVHAMHDVTEGGIIGAVWEMCEAGNVGCLLYKEQLPIDPVTNKICEYFSIDPLKLISSGVMLMSMSREQYSKLLPIMHENEIQISVIGMITSGKGRYLCNEDKDLLMEASPIDEIYKVIK